MKTPREILLRRHRAVEPRLDALREELLGRMSAAQAATPGLDWFALLRSFRGHLAGLGAAWLVILAFSLDAGEVSSAQTSLGNIASSGRLMNSVRENRRQILELTASSTAEEEAPVTSLLPGPRSEARNEERLG